MGREWWCTRSLGLARLIFGDSDKLARFRDRGPTCFSGWMDHLDFVCGCSNNPRTLSHTSFLPKYRLLYIWFKTMTQPGAVHLQWEVAECCTIRFPWVTLLQTCIHSNHLSSTHPLFRPNVIVGRQEDWEHFDLAILIWLVLDRVSWILSSRNCYILLSRVYVIKIFIHNIF